MTLISAPLLPSRVMVRTLAQCCTIFACWVWQFTAMGPWLSARIHRQWPFPCVAKAWKFTVMIFHRYFAANRHSNAVYGFSVAVWHYWLPKDSWLLGSPEDLSGKDSRVCLGDHDAWIWNGKASLLRQYSQQVLRVMVRDARTVVVAHR